MKDLGELKYFLGIEFGRSKQGILMHQRKYALELISETGIAAAKPAITPVDANMQRTTTEHDEHLWKTKPTTLVDEELSNSTPYQRLIGKLMYLTMTRPSISYSVQTLSQFLQRPKKSRMDVALRIVKYIKNSPGQGILLSIKFNSNISAYCDAEWAGCSYSRKSVSGYLVKFRHSLISWKSKKQTTVLRNSAEAEYKSLATTVANLSS
ncbi:PREDICTED: uncharacterized protein LOC109217999 [Nicotiana attenuata]|uniref:uncharacterized protein LOC109217999 n=1 Tax=Nicotiana attenuata TaxID=49451 RepID=UPI000905586C|nr:PREDICTED: uncharacterized protein LOC109217999 [Nicotiana attenuata]